MKKNKAESLEYVGWKFWFVVFVIVAVPGSYLSFQLVREGTSFLVPIAMGGVGAAVGAGVVSWAVNAVLQYWAKRRRLAARKKVKKR
ncbi:MAG: hypothetical protein R6V12_04635 [Candidatus Hydrogenedentota bacterium]